MKKLELKETNKQGLMEGIKSDGKKYSVRKDRRRYFFPDEWNLFYKQLKNPKHKLLFLILLHTGARIMEALHLKPKNFDFERQTITFEIVKQRKAKRQYFAIGTTRTFFISNSCLKEVKKYIRENKLEPNDFLFMNKKDLPSNYESLQNTERRKYYEKYKASYGSLLKRKLKKAKIEDYYQFSLQNIRKTYGNWMRIFDIKLEELCYRMGHDMETYLSHYGSSIIFTPQERRQIMNILGEVK